MKRHGGQLDAFERAVRATVARHRMFDGAPRVLTAVSGGPDSMALLYALVRLRRTVPSWPDPAVAHLDHGLRGDESRADADFVAAAARELDLPFAHESVDVAAETAARGGNLEAVARDIRYAFLARAARALGASRVATGHTATDQAETVLMRLARGSGPDGLSGIAVVRPLAPPDPEPLLVRPLVGTTREEVLAYCAERGIAFRVDHTNEDDRLTRVYARRELLPRLERVAPDATRCLARAAALAADDRAYFEARVAEIFAAWNVPERGTADRGPIVLPADEVAAFPPAIRRRVLREAVRRARGDLRRLALDHVEALEGLLGSDRDGREAILPFRLRVRRDGPSLVVGAVEM